MCVKLMAESILEREKVFTCLKLAVCGKLAE